MEAHHLELYELLKPKLDAAPARALVLALSSIREDVVTTDYIDSLEGRFMARMEAFEARIDARFERLENVLTRRMITIMGAWTILAGSTVGWVAVLVR